MTRCKDCKFFNDFKYKCTHDQWGFGGKSVDPDNDSCWEFTAIKKECCGGTGDCGDDCCGKGACSSKKDKKDDCAGCQSKPTPGYGFFYGDDEG